MQRSLLATLLALVCLWSSATGQSQRTRMANPDSALQTILAALKGTPLTLRAAQETALGNATSVRTAEATLAAARGSSRREAGAFDPVLFFNVNRTGQKVPQSSFFAGASVLSTTQNTAAGGLRMNLPIGTGIEASLNTVRLETNSAFANLNPQYTTFAALNFRQPLLGGFTISAMKRSASADREEEAAKARYDQEVLAVNSDVEVAYWDVYAAERDYAVQRLTRDRAVAFLGETQTRAKAGLIGPNQVANARTFLAEQEQLLLDREEQLDHLSDALASLIGKRPDQAAQRYVVTDNPPGEFTVDEVEVLVRRAQESNLTLQAARAAVEARRALSKAASWEALPRLDLVASLGGNALAGAAQDVIFLNDTLRTTRAGSFGSAISQALQRKYPTWSVGFEVTVPIGLRTGLGERDRLEAEVEIAEQMRIQQSRAIEEEVRTNYRELANGKRRLEAAKEGVDAAQEQVRIGQIEFQNGRSTAFELVRLGADFAAAQQRYSQALVRSARAATNLRRLTSGAPVLPR